MFRDQNEELRRLEEQLLAEEDEEEAEEEYLDEETLDTLLEDPQSGDAPCVYQNFSNDYGKNLRNYATGYKAYNTDRTDVDPDEISREVLRPKRGGAWVVILLLLTALAVLAIALLYKKMGGLL